MTTLSSLLAHSSRRSVASEGEISALSAYRSPTSSFNLSLLSFTDFTGFSDTTTWQATASPSSVRATTCVSPTPMPITSPSGATMATPTSSDVHVTPSAGLRSPMRRTRTTCPSPTFRASSDLSSSRQVMDTRTSMLSDTPLMAVAVMVAVPSDTAVITPPDTVATTGSELFQFSQRFGLASFFGFSLPFTCTRSPGVSTGTSSSFTDCIG